MTVSERQSEPPPLSYGLAAVDLPIPMLILERDLTIRWISSAAIRDLRLNAETLLGRSWYDLFPESRSRRALHDELCRGERDVIDLPRVPLTLACGTRYFSLRLRPLHAPDGSVESVLGLGEDVTAQVEAERALAANEARFRAISTHSCDLVLISAADGTVTFANAAFERILGRRQTDFIGISVFDNMHPDDLPLAREVFERLVGKSAASMIEMFEFRARHENGSWRWLEITASSLLNDPAVRGIVLNCRDITDRKLAELALRASQAQIEAAVAHTGIGLWESGPDDNCRWLDNWCERFDVDSCDGPDRLQRWIARIHPEDLERYLHSDADAVSGRSNRYTVEYRVLTRGGHWRWLHERGTVVAREASGRAQRFVGVCLDIDEHKKTELALRQAEDRYELAINAARLPVWEYAVPTDTVTGNVYWYQAVGHNVTEADARNRRETWLSDVHPDDAPRHTSVYTSGAADDKGFYQSEFRVKLPSGTYKWLLDRGRVVERAADGQPLKVVGISVDIDAQKTMQAALREGEARLETAIGGSDIGLWDWSVQSDALRWLSDWPMRKGIKATLAPTTYREMLVSIHPDDRARLEADVRSAIAGGRDTVETDYRLLSVHHDCRWVQIRAKVIERGPDGQALRVVGACLDVDASKRAEQLLRAQAKILETMHEGVVLFDRSGRIDLVNAAFQHMFRCEASRITGSSIVDLFTRRQADQQSSVAAADLVERLRNQIGQRDVVFRRTDDTEFTAEVVTTPIALPTGERWLAVVQDVSERKRLEQEVLDIANSERRRFGHELHDGLCQELTGIALILRCIATNLQREILPTDRQLKEVIELVNATTESARAMAQGLSPVTLDRGGLVPALKALVQRARKSYGITVRLRSKVPIELLIAESSASHLYRIAQEAIHNAATHGGARGVTVTLQADDYEIRLSVADDGTGLPADAVQGPGMGLKIMDYRARLMGGVIDVAPRRGGGTEIHCVCPAPARQAFERTARS